MDANISFLTVSQLLDNLNRHEDTLIHVVECHHMFLANVQGTSDMNESTYQSISAMNKTNWVKNTELLQWLRASVQDNNRLLPVLQVLKEDDQVHVANLIEDTEEGPRPLSKDERSRITKVKAMAAKEMISDVLTAPLHGRKAIAARHEEELNVIPIASKKSLCLIEIIQRRSKEAFETFLDVLRETSQSHVADIFATNPDYIVASHVNMVQNPDNITDEIISQKFNIVCATKSSLQTVDCREKFDFFNNIMLPITGSNPANSVSIFIMCKDLKSLDKLTELSESQELKSKLEDLINLIIAPAKPVGITVTVDKKDLIQLRAKFMKEESEDSKKESKEFKTFADYGEGCSSQSQQTLASSVQRSQISLSAWIERKNNTIDRILEIVNKLPSTDIKEKTEIELHDFKTKNDVKTISVVLDGQVGSGKSTLLNALLNVEKCTPTGGSGLSVTETVVEISASSNNKYEATIELYDEIEWEKIIEIYALSSEEEKELVDEETDWKERKATEYSIDLTKFVETIFSENKSRECILNKFDYITSKLIQISCDSADMLFNNVSGFVTVKSKRNVDNIRKFVKCVKMRIPNVNLLTKVNFVDLPGRGDSKRPINMKAEEHKNNCDVIWIVTPISRCLGDDARNIVGEEFSKKLQRTGRAGSISFICTMTDVIGDEDMKDEIFTKCQEEINDTEDKIQKNKDERKACSPRDPHLNDLKIEGCDLTEILDGQLYKKKELKEGVCLLRSEKVKTELSNIFPEILNENNGVFKVHCVSSKEYVKCIKERHQGSEIFTTIEATGIANLSEQVEHIFNEKNLEFTSLQLSKMCSILSDIVESMLSPVNLTSSGDISEKSSTDAQPKLLLSDSIQHIREEFVADIKRKHQDLETKLSLQETTILAQIQYICRSWQTTYRPLTYYATVNRNGCFQSFKYGVVDFNEQLSEIFTDVIWPEWLEFFRVHIPLQEFKDNFVKECSKCYNSAPSKWSLRSNELPKFVEFQLQSAVNIVEASAQKNQQSTIELILKTTQECMQPAYARGQRQPRGKGRFKELTDTIENHVQHKKKEMLKKLRERTTVALNTLIIEIEKQIENCCTRTIGDLAKRPMYQQHVEEYNRAEAINQSKNLLNDISDVLTELNNLDTDKSISGEVEQVKSKLKVVISDLSNKDGSPATKKPRLTKQ